MQTILSHIDEIKQIDVNNELDVLILTLSSYFDYERYLPQGIIAPIDLKTLKPSEHISKQANYLQKKHFQLYQKMHQSEAFRQLKILDFKYDFNEKVEKQFAAITYLVNNKYLFIAFRGTDATVLGWKEDFNMSFAKEVPSQTTAKEYVNQIGTKYQYDIYIGGHSKGGNIAVYASAFCVDNVKDRIKKVYNFDGPGFQPEIVKDEKYQQILSKVQKYIPSGSIIGNLLSTDEPTIIVESNQFGIYQHDAYSWIIKDSKFKQKNKLTIPAKKTQKSINKLLMNVSPQQREYIVDEIYKGFSKLGIESVDNVKQYVSIENLKKAMEIYNDVDPELKQLIKEIGLQLIMSMLEIRS